VRGVPETIRGIVSALNGRSPGIVGLPLRQTVGLVESLIRMAGLDGPGPDHSTLCPRQARVGVLAQIPENKESTTVTGKGAYDTRRCRTALIERGADAVMPIRRNGRLWKQDRPAALDSVLGPMAHS